MFPGPDVPDVGGFSIGFQTLPTAIEQMPGANFWAVALFFTLMTLGFSSAFAMLDAVVTLTMDSGVKYSRPVVVTSLTLLSLAFSLPYCTEFGYWLLDGVDKWVNDVALVFVVWSECVTSTTVYRWRDVEGQVGKISFILYQIAFFGGQILGVAIAQGVSAWAGAVTGFAIYLVFTAAALVLSKTPDIRAPWIFGSNAFMAKVFYLAFYSVSHCPCLLTKPHTI
jgi:solute carrier family 6 GABA transporter-like protein 1